MLQLSPNQERYLLAEMRSESSYFVSVWYPCQGSIDQAAFRAAIEAVIEARPSCRTGFVRDVEQGFRPAVHDNAAFDLHFLDTEVINDASVQEATAKYLEKITDFADPSALQCYFVLTALDGSKALVFSQHHAITDGRSLDLFIAMVAESYNGNPVASCGEDLEPAYSAEAVAKAEEHFQNRLGEIEEVTGFHRDLGNAPSRIVARTIDLQCSLSNDLNAAAASSSPFGVLAASFAMQIYSQTGSSDVLFSIQSAGRSRETKDAMGSFSNALPVAINVDPHESFLALSARSRNEVREAVAHEALPYHRIQNLTGIKADFALNLYPDAPKPEFDGLTMGERRFLPSPTEYGINLRWQRHQRDEGQAYEGQAYFDQGQIDSARIDAFLQKQRRILEVALNEPNQSVAEILERCRVIEDSDPLDPAPQGERLFELVERSATKWSKHAAVRFQNKTLSYSQLWHLVEERASVLSAAGIVAGNRVAFISERSTEFVINLLALSRIGASFAAFDPAYPVARMIELASALEPDAIIADGTLAGEVLMSLTEAGFDCRDYSKFVANVKAPRPHKASPHDVAYYLFTSGTTGLPRVIGIGHAALPAFIAWQGEKFAIDRSDRVTMLSGLSHDPVMRDILLPLTSGGSLLIPEAKTLRDPRRLMDWLRQERPTVIHGTPPLGRLISTLGDIPLLHGLRWIFWGGDLLQHPVVSAFAKNNPDLGQVNFYGSTETPQAVCFHEIVKEDFKRTLMPIGKGHTLSRVRVIGRDNQFLEVNEVGEVEIDTPYSVALSAKDVPKLGQRYRTGDVGYKLPNGAIMLLGRRDDQVKIRGYRVELADVAKHLLALEGVSDSVVLAQKAPTGEQQLVAHVVFSGSDGPEAEKTLRRRMTKNLPTHYVPAQIFFYDRIPLLPNGKLDRSALLAFEPSQVRHDEFSGGDAPEVVTTAAENRIIAIFESVLGRKIDSPDRSFAELGADSLNSVQALLRLESIHPDVPDDWYDLSIADLAQGIPEDHTASSTWSRFFRSVRLEPGVPLRAVAIILIVAFHFKLVSIGGGLTFVLFFLAGIAFARFQLPTILASNSSKSIVRSAVKVAVVSAPIGLLLGLHRLQTGQEGAFRMMTFQANFIDYASLPPGSLSGMWLWFIGCYLQIMLFLALALRSARVRQILAEHAKPALLIIVTVFCAARFVVPGILIEDGLKGIAPISIWTFLPTAHAGTFLLGAFLESTRKEALWRYCAVGFALIYALATYYYFPGNEFALTAAAILAVYFIPAIPTPRLLASALILVSQASLYIYLFHEPLHFLFREIGIQDGLITLVLVIPLSIVLARLIDVLYDRLVNSPPVRLWPLTTQS